MYLKSSIRTWLLSLLIVQLSRCYFVFDLNLKTLTYRLPIVVSLCWLYMLMNLLKNKLKYTTMSTTTHWLSSNYVCVCVFTNHVHHICKPTNTHIRIKAKESTKILLWLQASIECSCLMPFGCLCAPFVVSFFLGKIQRKSIWKWRENILGFVLEICVISVYVCIDWGGRNQSNFVEVNIENLNIRRVYQVARVMFASLGCNIWLIISFEKIKKKCF